MNHMNLDMTSHYEMALSRQPSLRHVEVYLNALGLEPLTICLRESSLRDGTINTRVSYYLKMIQLMEIDFLYQNRKTKQEDDPSIRMEH